MSEPTVSLLQRDEFIPLADCEPRRLYLIHSRNLTLGVYDPAQQGFIGVREKFGSRYLFTEMHWELGAQGFGTVKPLEALELLPEEIELRERTDTTDGPSGRPVAFDRPVADGGKGWYFMDTGEADQTIRASSRSNPALLAYLERRLSEFAAQAVPPDTIVCSDFFCLKGCGTITSIDGDVATTTCPSCGAELNRRPRLSARPRRPGDPRPT
jgi:hypothetical protein